MNFEVQIRKQYSKTHETCEMHIKF